MHTLAVLVALTSMTPMDIEIMVAALAERVDAGLQAFPEAGKKARISEICVADLDGRDLPAAIVERVAGPTIKIYQRSRCPRVLRDTSIDLRLGPPRALSPKQSEVRWGVPGAGGTLLVCRQGTRWKVCGGMANAIGTSPTPPRPSGKP